MPSGQQAKYLAAVADAGALPPNFNTILENALDKGGPWESREATRERLKIARQQTLSEIVRAMYWVENAIVLYDEHESRGVRNSERRSKSPRRSASSRSPAKCSRASRAKNIQKLVAHSVNMKPKDVGITNLATAAGGTEGDITYDVIDDEFLKTRSRSSRKSAKAFWERSAIFPA